MLVDLKTILSGTREGGYAVGLFNCVTLEMTRGIIAAAEELRSPVIIGPGESLLPGASLPDYADMMLGIARRSSVRWPFTSTTALPRSWWRKPSRWASPP